MTDCPNCAPRTDKPTCKHCGSTRLTEFTSTNQKWCHDCESYQHWPLEYGQKPIFDGMKPPKG